MQHDDAPPWTDDEWAPPGDDDAVSAGVVELAAHRGNPPRSPSKPQPVWMLACEYEAKPVTYLWPKFVPRGEFVLFEGKKKVGKSSVVAAVVATSTPTSPKRSTWS